MICELRDNNLCFRGVKGLAYSKEFGNSLLSYGFQGHINIWCPETSLTRFKRYLYFNVIFIKNT